MILSIKRKVWVRLIKSAFHYKKSNANIQKILHIVSFAAVWFFQRRIVSPFYISCGWCRTKRQTKDNSVVNSRPGCLHVFQLPCWFFYYFGGSRVLLRGLKCPGILAMFGWALSSVQLVSQRKITQQFDLLYLQLFRTMRWFFQSHTILQHFMKLDHALHTPVR